MKAIRKVTSLQLNAFLFILTNVLLTSGMLLPAMAQVTSDGTTNTIVNQSGNNFTILNGIEKSSNLFHSFRELSVPTGGSATFNLVNTPNITTIFSRVTGGNVSNIQGLIQTLNSNNPVSLFLMNPAGIVFGKNASLNIGGSFVGTTANSIKFADGMEFSAVNPTSPSLLTISVPIGLQMGSNPAPITVQGNGHRLTTANPNFPATPSATPTGLQVQPGQTLALIGGNLGFTGGTLTATHGQVVIAAVANGQIGLTASAQGWDFDYSGVSSFRDIQLAQQSMLNASGIGGGRIQVQGANVGLTDGSTALIQSFGLLPGGGIQVRATDTVNIQGSTPNEIIASGLRTNQLGRLGGGSIKIDTRRLSLQQGGEIRAQNYGTGDSSAVQINATESLAVVGFTPLTRRNSTITTRSFGVGASGAITLTSRDMTLLDGGGVVALAFSTGEAGNVTANVDRTLLIKGTEPTLVQRSGIASASVVTGNAGQVLVNAQRINIQAGGRISSSASAQGNGGNLTVNASESITVQGKGNGLLDYSSIDASVIIFDEAFRRLYNLPPVPSGASGNLTVTTSQLNILDGGVVGVRNDGTGNAGNLVVNANTIRLDRQGRITASTQAGEGGNLNVKANSLILRHNSSITATASSNGNGGNVTINAPVIVGFENGDIIANAIAGRGGNINITTQGIFGLKYRDRLTPENDITASSEFGVNGTVDINNFGVDPSSGLVELPVNLVDSSQQIATGCSSTNGSSFVATGRGGVPHNPNQQVMSDRTWSDIRDISVFRKTGEVTAQIPPSLETLVQATSWHRNAEGKIELIAAAQSIANVQQALTCAAISR
ncbi:MAG: filamentous hemagglutinin N-terminal domain-containing protein [Desmonostoc vinosum HA7617-LM4]|jgi:filamentous hemagglutinin family protein|nr:filamentous hemagglutinin N-terminal domain-containing protein [Desmonostoc vinosum HA7617-LM4]